MNQDVIAVLERCLNDARLGKITAIGVVSKRSSGSWDASVSGDDLGGIEETIDVLIKLCNEIDDMKCEGRTV